MAIKRIQDADFLAIKSVVSFYDSSDAVEPHEFTFFAAQLLENNSSMSSLQWIPRLKQSQRVAFESDANLNGLPGFKIVEADKGALVEAPAREEYYPIYYIEPQKKHAPLIGYDLASIPAYMEAMRKACDTGNLASAPEIILPGEKKSSPSCGYFFPSMKRKRLITALKTAGNICKALPRGQYSSAGWWKRVSRL